MTFVPRKRVRLATGEQFKAMGVDPDPNRRTPMDQIDHTAFAGHAICALVEVGAIPYRERYKWRGEG